MTRLSIVLEYSGEFGRPAARLALVGLSNRGNSTAANPRSLPFLAGRSSSLEKKLDQAGHARQEKTRGET
jgi:hypothetical protein